MTWRSGAKKLIEKIRSCINDARKFVFELYERKGWAALGYDSWRECVIAEFDQSKSHLYRLLDAAKVEQNISPMGENGKQIAERVLRPLVRLSPDQQRQAWAEATKTTNNPTAKEVQNAVEKVNGQQKKASKPPGATRGPLKPHYREAEIETLFDQGLTHAQIAEKIGVSKRIIDDVIEHIRIRREAEAKIDPACARETQCRDPARDEETSREFPTESS